MARLHHLLSRALASNHLLRSPPLPFSARPTLPLHSQPPPAPPPHPHGRSPPPFLAAASRHYASSLSRRRRRGMAPPMFPRRRRARLKGPAELSVQIGIEEALPDDPLILSIAETLRTDAGKAMKLAFHNLGNSEYKTRDPCISNVDEYDSVEVSVLLCDDDFIRKLNKEWRDEDRATDVLSMSQHIPGLQIPVVRRPVELVYLLEMFLSDLSIHLLLLVQQLQLGDLVISVDTARRQAEERGHALLDEIRILMVHGLLHLLGFDHELSKEAEEEMEQEEEKILNTLEWIGKGLIRSAYHFSTDMGHSENSDEANRDIEKRSLQESHQPKLTHIVCDIDGRLHSESIESLREAVSRGVTVIMLTGKTRASTIATFKLLNMEGRGDFISENSAGVFLQGSLVYGEHGQLIYRANLDVDICKEACLYSLKHKIPLVAYCEEQCLTLFEHPSVDLLHTVHHETKVKVMPSVEDLLEYSSIQKLLFLATRMKIFLSSHGIGRD
ncbi:unnamed protein product [Triticum turgidum subsp. durum]|uniref:Uncharacterized protein n=1 Tax=Triticum turgidum subsp. durum TaxID=4567 RepID=A0A9R1PZP8_TRITD|nr:unnamed protein product [Triticum turgidum subsp. durum]